MQVIRKNYKTFAIILPALNVLGALLVLFSPFGGMTVATFSGPRERFASLFSEYSEPLDNLFIILIAVSLIITAFLSFRIFMNWSSNHRKNSTQALAVSIITVLLTVIGGVIYNSIRAEIDYQDWWLDTGFYTGLIVGLVNSIFCGLVLRRR